MTPRNFSGLASAVQRNCDISDARHAADYGMCTFLLKMREYYRWERELPLTQVLPRSEVGDWLSAREAEWRELEAQEFVPLPLESGAADPLAADEANRDLLPRGLVYSAGYGRFGKPVFFLGALLRVQEREGCQVIVSSCEYARELSAPPAMLLGRTIYVRMESVRRYLWERIEEWHWRRLEGRRARALASYDFVADPESALARMAENEAESMILHELGEARAGELLGPAWKDMVTSVARTPAEAHARALRDLLADCLSTLPALVARENVAALHFHFATYDAPRRELFPQGLVAYEEFVRSGSLTQLARAAREGAARFLTEARALL